MDLLDSEIDRNEAFDRVKDRAISRSLIYESLDASFSKTITINKLDQSNNESINSNFTNNNIFKLTLNKVLIESLGILKGVKDIQKLNRSLDESVDRKAIVLDNSAAQSKSKSRRSIDKKKFDSIKAEALSNKRVKILNVVSPGVVCSASSVMTLHNLWKQYIFDTFTQINENQLTSRIQTCELLGAQVIIIDSYKPKHKGRRAIITANSNNTISLSYVFNLNKLTDIQTLSNPQVHVITIIKTLAKLGIILPQLHRQSESSIQNNSNSKVESEEKAVSDLHSLLNSNLSNDSKICLIHN